jgi:hypothetical protein
LGNYSAFHSRFYSLLKKASNKELRSSRVANSNSISISISNPKFQIPNFKSQIPKPKFQNPNSKSSLFSIHHCNPQPTTRNSQPETRNPQLETRNSQLATRNSQAFSFSNLAITAE